jgi:hypothetical protein
VPSLNWNALNNLQLGKYAEYYAKMELSSYGFDVYSSEVDDHGIDFIVKTRDGDFLEFQVKSVLRTDNVFLVKKNWDITNRNLYLFIMTFVDGFQPKSYIIPATAWGSPNALLKDYEYIGKKSDPEYALKLTRTNQHLLEPYGIDVQIAEISLQRST